MSQYQLSNDAKQLAKELYQLSSTKKIKRNFILYFTNTLQGLELVASGEEALNLLIQSKTLIFDSIGELEHYQMIRGSTNDGNYQLQPPLFEAVENNFEKPEEKSSIHIQAGAGANIAVSGNGNVSQTIINDSQKLADAFAQQFGQQLLSQHTELKQILAEMSHAINETQQRGAIARILDYVAHTADITGLVGFGISIGQLLK